MKSDCVVCQKRISWAFSLCAECEGEYGKRAADWPDWLRELVNASRRERTSEKRFQELFMDLSSDYFAVIEDTVTYSNWQHLLSIGERVIMDSVWA
jgi:hypothetical protein